MSIKISELTPKGANLEATDLLEISESTADGYSSKSITGAEIITAAQEGLQPTLVSGTNIKTINSTSLLGSGDVAVQSTLVSGTNIKTINGNSLLGSGDLVIGGGGLTIGTTAITSGTIGRILFEGTGNILQESANFSWDNTNRTLRVVTADPSTNARVLDITNSGGFGYFIRTNSVSSQGNSAEFICNNFALGTIIGFSLQPNGNASFGVAIGHAPTNYKTIEVVSTSNTAGGFLRMRNANSSAVLDLFTDTTEGVAIASNVQLTFRTGASGIKGTWFGTGNLLISSGTQTDAGFKLDVNGTTRIQSNLVLNGSSIYNNSNLSIFQTSTNRPFSVIASVTKSNGAERILFSLNSNESSNQQAMDFGYIGATALTNRYYYLQSSESGVGYGGGVVLQHNGGWASVGSSSYIASAVFHVASTNRGFLPPRMTNAQMVAIATPASGLMVYDTTNNKMCVYDGTAWQNLY